MLKITGFILLFATMVVMSVEVNSNDKIESTPIVIGSKKFTESIILGEILKHNIIKNNPNISVRHLQQIGSTRILWSSLLSGQIDVYTEYTGTLEHELVPESHKSTGEINKYLDSLGVGIGYHIGFNNSYALGVTKEFSEKFKLQKISDLKKIEKINFAFTEEFLNREDGWQGLKKHYNVKTSNLKSIDHDIAYRALLNGDVHVVDLYTTDPEIKRYDLVVLEDDLNFFSKYKAIYLYNKKNTSLMEIFKNIHFKITESDMVKMNYDAKFRGLSEVAIAKAFLQQNDLSKETAILTEQIIQYSCEHLWIVGVSLLFGLPLGIFLGTASHYIRYLKLPTVYFVSFFQTVPSIAFLVFLIGPLNYFGFSSIGNTPAIITLFLYCLMPVTTTTLNALDSTPKNYSDIADILNIKFFKRLFCIKYPLAIQEILNSIKNTVIATIGSATLGALVGAGGLGQPILSGIRLDNYKLILIGIMPAIVFIIITHLLFKVLEYLFVSKGLKI